MPKLNDRIREALDGAGFSPDYEIEDDQIERLKDMLRLQLLAIVETHRYDAAGNPVRVLLVEYLDGTAPLHPKDNRG